MKKPDLKVLLKLDEYKQALMYYYVLREVGYTAEEFDECVDELKKENPMLRDIVDTMKPYLIEAMDKAVRESENEDRT